MARKDLTGKRFGRLVCLRDAGRDQSRCVLWHCKCDCGRVITVRSNSLLTGNTQSCGCLQREAARREAASRTTHNACYTRVYRIWAHLKERCLNPNCKSYRRYGGRGIAVCDQWLEFEHFHRWAMANGYADNLTIDRIDNDGPYSPENCRWVGKVTQANNTCLNHVIHYRGERMTVAQAARRFKIPATRLYGRLQAGWTIERALSEPVDPRTMKRPVYVAQAR